MGHFSFYRTIVLLIIILGATGQGNGDQYKHVRETYTPLTPLFIEKLGFAGVYLTFVFSIQNIDCGYSLEQPRLDGFIVYSQSMFWKK